MSAQAMGHVFANSPYAGVSFCIHLALADSANDQHGNEIWARQEWIAKKARTTRQTVNTVLSRMVAEGHLEILQDNSGNGAPNRYRLVLEWGVSREPTGGVGSADRGGVAVDDTEPKGSNPKRTSGGRKRPRQRDELFEALAEACNYDWKKLTKNERGRLNEAVKQLRDVGATPEEVRRRAAVYRTKWDGIDVTPQAIASNWNTLTPPKRKVREPAKRMKPVWEGDTVRWVPEEDA